jgi:flagellar secretion chaperone FliS
MTQCMYENPYAFSLEARILSATPMELVKLLYQAAIEAVQDAREQLSRGEIMERGRSVSKALKILAELSGSLDHAKGGELSGRLAALYDFAQRTLLDANFRQADDGLEKVEELLKTLYEAWSGIDQPQSSGFREPQPAVYEEYASRAAQQWCA